ENRVFGEILGDFRRVAEIIVARDIPGERGRTAPDQEGRVLHADIVVHFLILSFIGFLWHVTSACHRMVNRAYCGPPTTSVWPAGQQPTKPPSSAPNWYLTHHAVEPPSYCSMNMG